ncbi:MAG: NAD(P)H-dependent oxidoreductase subunit E [Peptococcaceae bacterium]|nr:NAD(P)H-dependent oxidoreductase subunit E [Peptococcaceae bacterium]
MSQVCDQKKLDAILEKHNGDPGKIIAILQDTQEEYHYLPREAFEYYAEKLGMSRAKVFSIATFYENFSLVPKGKYVIRICDGTACHVRKSVPILERLRGELGLSAAKKTTDDLGFTIETVSCLGACGLAPVLTVNDKVYPAMTPDKASALVKELKGEL